MTLCSAGPTSTRIPLSFEAGEERQRFEEQALDLIKTYFNGYRFPGVDDDGLYCPQQRVVTSVDGKILKRNFAQCAPPPIFRRPAVLDED